MNNNQHKMNFDLEERTQKFAKLTRDFVRKVNPNFTNRNDLSQLLRSSGSVGANYIEANEALSKKDFIHRIRIARKEVKESRYWLTLIKTPNTEIDHSRIKLIDESTQLLKIFSKIISSSTGRSR